jgi:hypothetical protein
MTFHAGKNRVRLITPYKAGDELVGYKKKEPPERFFPADKKGFFIW